MCVIFRFNQNIGLNPQEKIGQFSWKLRKMKSLRNEILQFSAHSMIHAMTMGNIGFILNLCRKIIQKKYKNKLQVHL